MEPRSDSSTKFHLMNSRGGLNARRSGSLLVVFAAVLSLLAWGASPSTAAKKSGFPVKVGSILLTFPSKPVASSVKANVATGTVDVPTWAIDGGLVLASGFPIPGITKANASNVLKSSLDGAVSNVGGKLRTSKTDTYAGFPSVSAIIDVPAGTLFQRIVIDTKTSTLVQLVGVSVSPKAKTPPANYTKLEASGKPA